ncbi:MAG TPA: PDZ domain-containing protein [Gemmatimonadales bacterium]|nr:PDZ domain-containing protein [Gemmatimonadales bacterium]
MFVFRYFLMAGRAGAAAFALAAVCTVSAAAQQGVAQACPAGTARIGTLGYAELECSNCTLYQPEDDPLGHRWEFSSEPTIGGIKADGPAAGKLREGDVVAAIDGHLITTREGGRRFSQLQIGTPVTLTVRRGERTIDVSVTPAAKCERLRTALRAPRVDRAPRPVREPRPPRPTAAPRPRRTVEVPAPPPPPEPRARLGFSIRCSNCTIDRTDEAVVWSFREPPTVQRVERDGPAYAAGIRSGDILTHINAVPLTTEEGGRLFGAVEAGDTVSLRLVRNGMERDVGVVPESKMVLARRLLEAARVRGVAPEPTPLVDVAEPRFSGNIGDAFVQVTGGPITVTRTEEEIVIRSQDITVRITTAGGS